MTGVDPDPSGIRARTRRAMVRTPAAARPEPEEEALPVSFEWTPPGHVDQVALLMLLRRLRARAGASSGGGPVRARRLAVLDGLVDGVRTGGPVRVSTKGLDRDDREVLFRVFTAGLKHFRGEDDPAVEGLVDLVGRWERFTFGPGGFRGDADTKARRLAARDAAQWSTSELTR